MSILSRIDAIDKSLLLGGGISMIGSVFSFGVDK